MLTTLIATAGAMCALASMAWPQWSRVLTIGYVASLATKLSDTFASEIGKVEVPCHRNEGEEVVGSQKRKNMSLPTPTRAIIWALCARVSRIALYLGVVLLSAFVAEQLALTNADQGRFAPEKICGVFIYLYIPTDSRVTCVCVCLLCRTCSFFCDHPDGLVMSFVPREKIIPRDEESVAATLTALRSHATLPRT